MLKTRAAKQARLSKRRWRAAHPLNEAGKLARREYTRRWFEAHPEKAEQYRATRAAKQGRP